MKQIFVLILAALTSLTVMACSSPPKLPTADQARNGLQHLDDAVTRAAEECTQASRTMTDELAAEKLVDICVNVLIPARDAVHFAKEAADPWFSPGATQKIACAAKATATSLYALCTQVKCSDILKELAAVAADLGKAADAKCDPRHPTTEVTMIEDWRIPRIEPNYPATPVPLTP